MRPRLVIGGAIGTLLTLVAALALFAPDLATVIPFVSTLVEHARNFDAQGTLLAAGLVLALAAVVVARTSVWQRVRGGQATDAFDEATARPPEDAIASERTVTGAALEDTVDRAVAGDETAIATVRARLATLAADVYARSTDSDPEGAASVIQAGDWTDDRVAAAFLAEGGAVKHTIWARLRLWLAPERERRRRVDRTLAAIRSRLEGGS